MDNDQKGQFIKAYNDYADAIYRYCFFRVYSRPLAEELMQETFARMWQYMNKEKPIENIQAFLYRIARNLVVDSHRKKTLRNKNEECLHASPYSTDNAIELSYDGRCQQEQNALLQEGLEEIQQLPPHYCEVLILRYLEGLTPRKIATLLHTSPNTISVRIYKAIKKLKSARLQKVKTARNTTATIQKPTTIIDHATQFDAIFASSTTPRNNSAISDGVIAKAIGNAPQRQEKEKQREN